MCSPDEAWAPCLPSPHLHAGALDDQSCLGHVCAPVICHTSLPTSTAGAVQMIGHAGQAPNPGDYFTGSIADINYVVVRGDDNRLRAFHNVSGAFGPSVHASCILMGIACCSPKP